MSSKKVIYLFGIFKTFQNQQKNFELFIKLKWRIPIIEIINLSEQLIKLLDEHDISSFSLI